MLNDCPAADKEILSLVTHNVLNSSAESEDLSDSKKPAVNLKFRFVYIDLSDSSHGSAYSKKFGQDCAEAQTDLSLCCLHKP